MTDTFLIAGLGNPGREYAANRHNVGFRIADAAAQSLGVRFSRQQSEAFIASTQWKTAKVILAKPQTYMNLSGRSVSALMRFYQVPVERLIVCCDDIDLPFGTLRLRASGGSAGQRGMQSILDSLSTREIPRLRFGVGRPPGRMDAADYVLQSFNAEEESFLPALVEKAAEAALVFVETGLETAMNRYNGGPGEPAG
jgi:PTH1 family peptidyl-tRNA hydrolase